jgi:F-type H+-transporting ATPase subunit epsilon
MKLEIVTPEKMIFSQNVEMVTLPGTEGDFGVLDNHSPLVSELREGEIAIYSNQNSEPSQKLNIKGGVAQVSAETCTVLTTIAS